MAFLQWRALIARAAGYAMEIQQTDEGFQYEAPKLDFDGITLDNTLGVWDTPPDEPLLIVLAHMSHEGIIRPADAGLLAGRLEGLLADGSLLSASYAHPDSIAAHVERLRTEQMIEGLRRSERHGVDIVFSLTED